MDGWGARAFPPASSGPAMVASDWLLATLSVAQVASASRIASVSWLSAGRTLDGERPPAAGRAGSVCWNCEGSVCRNSEGSAGTSLGLCPGELGTAQEDSAGTGSGLRPGELCAVQPDAEDGTESVTV